LKKMRLRHLNNTSLNDFGADFGEEFGADFKADFGTDFGSAFVEKNAPAAPKYN